MVKSLGQLMVKSLEILLGREKGQQSASTWGLQMVTALGHSTVLQKEVELEHQMALPLEREREKTKGTNLEEVWDQLWEPSWERLLDQSKAPE